MQDALDGKSLIWEASGDSLWLPKTTFLFIFLFIIFNILYYIYDYIYFIFFLFKETDDFNFTLHWDPPHLARFGSTWHSVLGL